jgi:hypothetical protein
MTYIFIEPRRRVFSTFNILINVFALILIDIFISYKDYATFKLQEYSFLIVFSPMIETKRMNVKGHSRSGQKMLELPDRRPVVFTPRMLKK